MSSRRDFIRQGLIAATAMGTLTAFDAKGLTIAAKGSVKKISYCNFNLGLWDRSK
ncbi:hypothetical protein [Sphingobacterium sp. B29]|uniref:hypothetical protein n=1 Tax=Sphingobacterium sp. B29 TaxID=1933220 RepID=UPI0012FA92D2|nr:hypothetical protein [Sphingobacterium sp. B29]